MPEPGDVSLTIEGELDRLFRKPIGAFVAERNKLVKGLRSSGNRGAAEEIARLSRPSPVAWVVNQLHFRAPELLDALGDAGAALRRAQESTTNSEEFAARKRVHREALRAAADRACALAEEEGTRLTADAKRRLEMNLNLLSAAAESTAPPPGRMLTELEPLGFDALAAAAPAALPKRTPRASAPEEAEHRRRVAATKNAFDAASIEVRRLAREAEVSLAAYQRAGRDAEDAERRADVARGARDDARRAADDAKARADAAREELEHARRALDDLET